MKRLIYCLLFASILFYCGCSETEKSEFPFYDIDGNNRGKQTGMLIPVENSGLLKIFVSVDTIKPGIYNLYLHNSPSCRENPPKVEDIVETKFPLLDGRDGTIKIIIISHDLTMDDIIGRSLIIHETAPILQENLPLDEEFFDGSKTIKFPEGKAVACVSIPQQKK